MKHYQITASAAKDIAFKLGAVLNDEEAGIFADGYNVALLKVNKNASTELPNYANLLTSSQAAPDDSGLLPCPFCGSPAEHYPDGDMEGYIIMCGNKNGDCNLQAFGFTTPEEAEKAWNTRAALLQGAEPVSQTYELPELIEGMEVSIDVSTCDADAGHRYFGTVTEISELDTAKNGYILLVQDAKPNFKQADNSPATLDCSCRTCRPVTFTDSRFVVCPECGNKRCPHANDHRNACTGSNELGQEGSAYPAAPQQEVK